jgi:hypothetical protein
MALAVTVMVKRITFEVRGAPLAARPVEAEGRNELDRNVRHGATL